MTGKPKVLTSIRQKLYKTSPEAIINPMKKMKSNVRKAVDNGSNFMFNECQST